MPLCVNCMWRGNSALDRSMLLKAVEDREPRVRFSDEAQPVSAQRSCKQTNKLARGSEDVHAVIEMAASNARSHLGASGKNRGKGARGRRGRGLGMARGGGGRHRSNKKNAVGHHHNHGG